MKITLCGSTRFKDDYLVANAVLTLAGHIVYSVAMWTHNDKRVEPSADEKLRLDAVHMQKILNSDAIFVVMDEAGYVGDSTKREIAFAALNGKPVLLCQNEKDLRSLLYLDAHFPKPMGGRMPLTWKNVKLDFASK